MSIREARSADAERIYELVESAMTASYALSPNEIETVVNSQFNADRIEEVVDSDEVLLLVVESDEDGTVSGVVEGRLESGEGEVRWLFVDPERRGIGYGSDLFEAAVDGLRERGADDIRATPLAANQEGGIFFEKFGYERRGEREVEFGGTDLVERIYAEEDGDGDGDSAADSADDDPEFPEGGTAMADGTEVIVVREDPESGTEGPFFQTYTDESRDERHGYYCGNCGSTDTAVDDVGRIRCGNCGNDHKSDGDQYDGGYL